MVSAVWGDWHVSMMLNANFPSLLASGNLPALVDKHDIEFFIYTTSKDKLLIEQSASFKKVSNLVPVILDTELFSSDPGNSPVIHHEAWVIVKNMAQKEHGLVWNMLPDVMFSDGSLSFVGDLIAAGKQAVMWFYPRAVAETFVPAVHSQWGDGDVLSVSGRDMFELNLRHLHPVMAAYFVDSPYFPNHPEILVWPIKGDGLLVRMLINVYNVFDPNKFQLTDQQLPALEHDTEEFIFITDSDSLFGVSLAPLSKDNIWYNRSRNADPVSIARWWLDYDSPANNQVVGQHIRFHTKKKPNSVLWGKSERRSDLFINKVISAREGMRIAKESQELGCRHAASVILFSMETGVLVHTLSQNAPALVFVPDDNAMEAIDTGFYDQLMAVSSRHFLIQFLRNHVVFINPSLVFDETSIADGQSMELEAASGISLKIRCEGRKYWVNDIPLELPSGKKGMHYICRIGDVIQLEKR